MVTERQIEYYISKGDLSVSARYFHRMKKVERMLNDRGVHRDDTQDYWKTNSNNVRLTGIVFKLMFEYNRLNKIIKHHGREPDDAIAMGD